MLTSGRRGGNEGWILAFGLRRPQTRMSTGHASINNSPQKSAVICSSSCPRFIPASRLTPDGIDHNAHLHLTRPPTSTTPPTTHPPTTAASTSTAPGNGVATPVPVQDGMVTNCNKFHFVQENQNCETIAALYLHSTVHRTLAWSATATSLLTLTQTIPATPLAFGMDRYERSPTCVSASSERNRH